MYKDIGIFKIIFPIMLEEYVLIFTSVEYCVMVVEMQLLQCSLQTVFNLELHHCDGEIEKGQTV